jgi:glyoxylase-like metal-dependent hydrolase (beta-lactamase superfamily II)
MAKTRPSGPTLLKALLTSALLAIALAPPPTPAQSPAQGQNDYFHTGAGARYLVRAKAPLDVQPLRGRITILSGSGGNITVLAGRRGKFLIDAGISPSRPKVETALQKLGRTPIRYVVNTHWHWDHTDGNAWMHRAGATIIAHRNTFRHLTQTTHVDDWNWTFNPVPADARPTILIDRDRTFSFAGETITLENFGPGHTDGDLLAYFHKADVLAMGDTFWNGHYPFIDNEDGGGINAAIDWANKAVGMSTDHTLLIPGHGAVGKRADLIAFRDMLVAVRDKVAAMKRGGKSLQQIIAAKPTAPFDAQWGGFVIGPDLFTRLVYDGLR